MKSLGATRPGAVARTQIDVAAAQRVANQFAVAAEFLDRAVTDHLARLAFGGAVAIAAALRSSAERYADAELYAAARIA